MAEELKPCPCCGEEAAFVELEDGGIVAVCASKDASRAVLHATHVETSRDRLLPRPGTPEQSPQAMWWSARHCCGVLPGRQTVTMRFSLWIDMRPPKNCAPC